MPSQNLKKESVVARIAALRRRFEGVKIIVGVDRLDYIKGVPQKLHALETFLEEHPEWIGKVVLVQVAVPSRGDVEEYRNLRASVNELVGRINGRFGTVEFMPIHFMHKSIPFDELTALYAVSDVCLVTSTRDGMNLVSRRLFLVNFLLTRRRREGFLRIHRLPKRHSWRPHSIRVRWRGPFTEWFADRQSLEHGRGCQCHQRSCLNVFKRETGKV